MTTSVEIKFKMNLSTGFNILIFDGQHLTIEQRKCTNVLDGMVSHYTQFHTIIEDLKVLKEKHEVIRLFAQAVVRDTRFDYPPEKMLDTAPKLLKLAKDLILNYSGEDYSPEDFAIERGKLYESLKRVVDDIERKPSL
jgi:hypothetical protein